ncbi:hypothetical protein MYOV003v1_p0078 [Vibrio phage 207E48.1]|nr:hypothetical protein MYOV003v1_p0078 [Vibrio phage 207E48.1]
MVAHRNMFAQQLKHGNIQNPTVQFRVVGKEGVTKIQISRRDPTSWLNHPKMQGLTFAGFFEALDRDNNVVKSDSTDFTLTPVFANNGTGK